MARTLKTLSSEGHVLLGFDDAGGIAGVAWNACTACGPCFESEAMGQTRCNQNLQISRQTQASTWM
jgi:hypothetical protein